MTYTCCFTGHRKIPKEDYGVIRRITRQYVEFLAGNGVTNFLAGGAVGYDLMCALIVLSLKEKFHDIRLEIVLPSPDYDRFFPEQVR